MAEYEVAMIHAFADRLLLRANLLVWFSTLAGMALGFGVVLLAARLVSTLELPGAVVYAGLAGMAGCLVGWQVGCWRADGLREQAQTALCLMEIARNPRREYD